MKQVIATMAITPLITKEVTKPVVSTIEKEEDYEGKKGEIKDGNGIGSRGSRQRVSELVSK